MVTFVPVVFAETTEQLQRSKHALDGAGIPNMFRHETTASTEGCLGPGPLMVPAQDEERACEVLASMDADFDPDPFELEDEDEDDFDDEEEDDDFLDEDTAFDDDYDEDDDFDDFEDDDD